jgi:hypothetical protein
MSSFAKYSSIALCLGAQSVIAQLSTTNIGPPSPMSIVLVPSTLRLDAIVSFVGGSIQRPINVTNPNAPLLGTLSAAVGQDQFSRAWYTPAFGGRLLTGHRGGGIRLWNAGAPLTGPLTVSSTTATRYSHEGLKTFTDTNNRTWLYYGDHYSGGTDGGLRVFEVGASSLTFKADVLTPLVDGNALEVGRDGRYCWQLGIDANPGAGYMVLRTYDTSGKSAATPMINELARVNLPQVTSTTYDEYLEKDDFSGQTMLATLGDNGIASFAVTAAVPVNSRGGPGQLPTEDAWRLPAFLRALGINLHARGVTFVPGTPYAILFGYIQVGTSATDFLWIINAGTSGPGTWSFIGNPITIPGFLISDVKVASPRIYVVGNQRTGGQAQLKIF